jgi:uncharacterized MnhB-related membrane protein
MDDTYLYVITALLPLSASMVVVQKNPYHALVIRGILGAVSALVYAVLGAADVALTEALVGTMLAITLYAVAVRSSLNMRLGVLKEDLARLEDESLQGEHLSDEAVTLHAQEQAQSLISLMGHLKSMLKKRHMRLELIPYSDLSALQQALLEREIHAICIPADRPQRNGTNHASQNGSRKKNVAFEEFPSYGVTTRIRRLYDLMQAEVPILAASLTYYSSTEQLLPTIPHANATLSTAKEIHS